ncbi:conserved hypothetical protein [Verticillium alfalfae VaMs.102]|uniref:Uncharacterized protein n=1 Tax=Verticillium alfalfae (strain VaMs.102 / ATCC MYA-4576 / FGSC 10136) TaxID=526221 RepID=C9S814_VERA1|nr:conserved hypothetical protein [Verticillium alfalfae VaMs.102]EEY15304.1 conserved hypothetical protein [Verticillium alfalfae VaMs.102]
MSSRTPCHASSILRQVARASRAPITASRAFSTSSTQYATAAVASSTQYFLCMRQLLLHSPWNVCGDAHATLAPVKSQLVDNLPKRFQGIKFGIQLSPSSTPRPPRQKTPLVHDLSEAAYNSIKEIEVPESSAYAEVAPLLVGPTAALVFPAVSPAHLAAAFKVLAPGPAGSATAPPTRFQEPRLLRAAVPERSGEVAALRRPAEAASLT